MLFLEKMTTFAFPISGFAISGWNPVERIQSDTDQQFSQLSRKFVGDKLLPILMSGFRRQFFQIQILFFDKFCYGDSSKSFPDQWFFAFFELSKIQNEPKSWPFKNGN